MAANCQIVNLSAVQAQFGVCEIVSVCDDEFTIRFPDGSGRTLMLQNFRSDRNARLSLGTPTPETWQVDLENGGADYEVDDVLYLNGGAGNCVVTVTGETAGEITTFDVEQLGSGYSLSVNYAGIGGSGTGAEFSFSITP